MGKLNQDFQHRRLFDFIAFIVFVLFLSLFTKSILSVMGAFEMEVYTNTMNEMAALKTP